MPVYVFIHHDQLTPPLWWIAPHTMADRPRFPSLGWTQASTSLSSCLRRSRTRPSLWYRENRDSSLKIQCLHCLRSNILCLLPHSHRRRLCSEVSLGHLAGRRDQYPAAVLGLSIWLRNGSMESTVFRSTIEHTTRNYKYRSNSRKCHLVVMIP